MCLKWSILLIIFPFSSSPAPNAANKATKFGDFLEYFSDLLFEKSLSYAVLDQSQIT